MLVMVDNREDINVSEAMVKSLAAVIGKHLPHHGQLDDDIMEAQGFMLIFFSPTGVYDVWNAEKEEAKLDELCRVARHLVSVQTSLHPSVRIQVEMASKGVKTVKDFRSLDRLPDLMTIFAVLPEMLERSIEAGKDEIRRGGSVARTNWLAVSVIDECRDVWHIRTGDEAPKTLSPESPFDKFVRDVFDVIGMKGKPRSAMQAWNRVQNYDENT